MRSPGRDQRRTKLRERHCTTHTHTHTHTHTRARNLKQKTHWDHAGVIVADVQDERRGDLHWEQRRHRGWQEEHRQHAYGRRRRGENDRPPPLQAMDQLTRPTLALKP